MPQSFMNDDLPDPAIAETALSVGGLTDYIRFLLEQDDELQRVWVTGEVSSANNHRSGLFFTLQDQDGVAAIKCVVWSSQLAKLAQIPTIGEQLIILGSIRVYRERGEYQLTVWQVLPGGVGLQALRFQQLRKRLEAEGLFDSQRKQPLPLHPQTIAVVTSPTAAAWGDIQKTLRQRYPGLHVLFSPATVQGEQAPESIVNALDRVERDGRAEVIILGRGGGAVEELACFNDERVVRAVANCSIPVIAGIGHQRDESLVDLVADVSVHTPTAAAELVVPALSRLYTEHEQRVAALREAVYERVENSQNRLQKLRDRLRRLRLERRVEEELRGLSWQRGLLVQAMNRQLQQASQRLVMLGEKLAALDPEAVLQRGYAVVRRENGVIVRDVADVVVGDELLVQLGVGEVIVRVVEEINRQDAKDAERFYG